MFQTPIVAVADLPKIEVDNVNAVFPNLNPEQQRFVLNRYPFVVGGGGYGSGKTTALICRVLLLSVDTPWFGDCSGSEGVLGRVKHLDLKKTTLSEFFRIIPGSWVYKYWDKDGRVELINESIIHLTHLESTEHIQSLNLAFFACDQMEQMRREVWDAMALERIRRKAFLRFDGGRNAKDRKAIIPKFDRVTGECISTDQREIDAVIKYRTAFGVCNPRHGSFIHELFVENEKYGESEDPETFAKYNPEYKYIHINVMENVHNLPGNYVERQQVNKSTREYERDVLGSWDSWSGKVYLGCDQRVIFDRNVIPHPSWDIYVGIDHGGTGDDKTMRTGVTAAAFIAYQHRAGQHPMVYIFDELYMSGSTIEESVVEIDAKLRRLHIAQSEHYPSLVRYEDGKRAEVKAWRCDPSMKKRLDEQSVTIIDRYMYHARLRNMKMPLIVGDNDWVKGIEFVDWMFRKGIMKICPRCTNTYSEHASLEYGDNEKVKPLQRDHLVTAVKYAVSAFPREFSTNMQIDKPKSIVDIQLERMMREQRSKVGGRYGN